MKHQFIRIPILFIFVIFLSQCKKENQPTECLNEKQKATLVNSLEYLSHDTTEISAAERQFMNEIRTIANDISSLTSAIDTTISIQNSYNQIKTNFLQHVDLVTQKASTFYNGSEAKQFWPKMHLY
jgi:flagellar biosynthesis/type III secretory pathway chaperone